MKTPVPRFACAPYIKEIGRGARGARGLSREAAYQLYRAILREEVSEVELGAVLMAYRIKGEDVEELAGMSAAVDETLIKLRAPAGQCAVAIPSYNGARRQPNLVPLLALLLARSGTPTLVHGVHLEPERVGTHEIFNALGFSLASDAASAERELNERGWSMLATQALSPALDAQLSLRQRLGIRNSAHTLAKLIQPFSGPALRLVNYTHPAYRDTLIAYFVNAATPDHPGVFLARGTEGEAVADPTLARETLWLCDGKSDVVIEAGARIAADTMPLPASASPEATAAWIHDVLADKLPVPAGIAAQVEAIQRVVQGQ